MSTIDTERGIAKNVNPASTAASMPARTSALQPHAQAGVTQNAPKRKVHDMEPSSSSKVSRPNLSVQSARDATKSPIPRPAAPAPRRPADNGEHSKAKPKLMPQMSVAPGVSEKAKATATQPTNPVNASNVPKKGGYLAMLERAKNLQDTSKTTGQIKHHRVQKQNISRREKERLAQEAKAAAKQPGAKPAVNGGVRSTAAATSKAQTTKPKIETSYKGTMRSTPPIQPAYRGTMGGTGSARPGSGKVPGKQSGASSRYRYAEDDEEDDEDEDMDDYNSASSDMEADMNDIDEEELLSTRVGRKEDEQALAEENELKRQKLERKRKLQALSSAAAAKRKVY